VRWRWPWVSRELYDLVAGVANRLVQERNDALAAAKVAERRYTELVERVLQMRREGFQPPAESAPAEVTPALPQKVVDAIAQVAASAAMERQLRLTAERLLRQEDGNEDKVAALILHGEDQEVLEEFLG